MFENLNENMLKKSKNGEVIHFEKPYQEKIRNVSLSKTQTPNENKSKYNEDNKEEDFSIHISVMKIKRNEDSFDELQKKIKNPLTIIKEIPSNYQDLVENQSNFSNHTSKNFVVIKENNLKQKQDQTQLQTRVILETPLRENDIDKEINPYDSIQYKILNTKNQENSENQSPERESEAEAEADTEKAIENIKFIYKINYENDLIELIDLTNINKYLGKIDMENLSKDLSREAEKYKCTEFKMNASLSFRSLRSFSKFFLNCNSLKFLDLSESSIGDIGCKYLAEAFLKSKNISEINLQKNMIGDNGAEILSKCIRVNKNIMKLELEHNLIGNFGGKKILESLKENNKIKWLNLFGNNCLDNSIISLISELLKNNRISNRPKKIMKN